MSRVHRPVARWTRAPPSARGSGPEPLLFQPLASRLLSSWLSFLRAACVPESSQDLRFDATPFRYRPNSFHDLRGLVTTISENSGNVTNSSISVGKPYTTSAPLPWAESLWERLVVRRAVIPLEIWGLHVLSVGSLRLSEVSLSGDLPGSGTKASRPQPRPRDRHLSASD